MSETPIELPIPVPETDMNRIAAVIGEQKEQHEAEPTAPHDAIRASLQTIAGIAPAPTAPASAPATSTTRPDYLAEAPENVRQQVEALVHTAQYKGIDAAHAEAKKATDPFVLDAFHDVMTGKLYRAFKDRGLLQ